MKKINRFLECIKRVLLKFFVITFFLSQFNVTSAVATDYSDKKSIPILLSTDNGYVYPTLVSMTSMVKNKKRDTFLEFNIMVSGDTSGENREKFKKFENIYGRDCSVSIINMGNRFKGIIPGNKLPLSAFYRLLASSYLPQYEKVLYIDGDTLVRHDLSKLFDTDINNYYIAGVKGLGMPIFLKYGEARKKYAKNLNIKDMDQYISSGVLLMNLKKLREDNLESKFLKYILNGGFLQYADQEVFNSVCYNKIGFLSPIYNDTVSFVFKYYNKNKRPEEFSNACSQEQWKRLFDDPVIVHYAGVGGDKPWKTQKVKFYDEWNSFRKEVDKNFYKKK